MKNTKILRTYFQPWFALQQQQRQSSPESKIPKSAAPTSTSATRSAVIQKNVNMTNKSKEFGCIPKSLHYCSSDAFFKNWPHFAFQWWKRAPVNQTCCWSRFCNHFHIFHPDFVTILHVSSRCFNHFHTFDPGSVTSFHFVFILCYFIFKEN